MAQPVRVHILIKGRVQGVFFRENTKQKARELGLTGWVRNLDSNDVEAVIEGPKEQIEKLVDWIKEGPALAKVDGAEVAWSECKDEFNEFVVRHD